MITHQRFQRTPKKSLDDGACACLEKNPNGAHIFSVSRDRDGVGSRFVIIIRLHGTGGVEDIRNGFPCVIHGDVRHWARYVISANYLLRYFYIQYIREQRLVGAPSNPIGHTGDPSWERRNPT